VLFTDNANGEDGIEIERKTGMGGTYTLVFTTSPLPGTQSGWYWPDTGMAAATTYCYRLRTKQGTSFSAYSNEACGTTTSSGGATAGQVLPEGTRPAPAGVAGATARKPEGLPANARPITASGPATALPMTVAPDKKSTLPPGARQVTLGGPSTAPAAASPAIVALPPGTRPVPGSTVR
jgi:hypothetical protein